MLYAFCTGAGQQVSHGSTGAPRTGRFGSSHILEFLKYIFTSMKYCSACVYFQSFQQECMLGFPKPLKRLHGASTMRLSSG